MGATQLSKNSTIRLLDRLSHIRTSKLATAPLINHEPSRIAGPAPVCREERLEQV
jgi:hypothetical protein